MNRLIAGFIGGVAGAATVTTLHECIRHCYAGAPRLDELGKEATAKVIDAAGGRPLPEDRLYYTSMVSDIIANTAYYSGAAAVGKHPLLAGTALGVMAGIGALKLPGKMGLEESATNASGSRQFITLALYTMGGMISGLIINRLTSERS